MNYPLPSRSEEDHWPMSHGLVEDVAEALSRHGYPRVTKSPEGAADFVRLRQHVWHFITDKECDVLDVPAAAELGETDRADDEQVHAHMRLQDAIENELREAGYDPDADVVFVATQAVGTEIDQLRQIIAQQNERMEAMRTEALGNHARQAERIAELVGQVEAQAGEVERLRAQANCGEGHDPERICCAHAKEWKRLRRAELDVVAAWEARRHTDWVNVELREVLDELAAALGAADEPTTGGAE